MQLEEAAPRPSFGRHETFHLRNSWLKRAYNRLDEDPKLFLSERAMVRLGMGKNMVNSVRFWGSACKMFEEDRKAHTARPTDLARVLFADHGGLDSYMEEPDTLWLLHWMLYAPPCLLPAWWIIMNEITATRIETDKVIDHVLSRVEGVERYKSPSQGSVRKDIDVFIHTYTSKRGKTLFEDHQDCPFRSLDILEQKDRDEMAFVYGEKPGLSPLVTAFACLDFADRTETPGRTVSLYRLAMEKGGPGSVFKIGEADMEELLTEAADQCGAISVKRTVGATNLSFEGTAADARKKVLYAMYGRKVPARRRGRTQEVLAA